MNLNWVQAYKADAYRTSQYNGRVQLTEYQSQRGSILDVNGSVIANSVPTTKTRSNICGTYPLARRSQPIVGYRPVNLGATGVETR